MNLVFLFLQYVGHLNGWKKQCHEHNFALKQTCDIKNNIFKGMFLFSISRDVLINVASLAKTLEKGQGGPKSHNIWEEGAGDLTFRENLVHLLEEHKHMQHVHNL